MPISFPCPQHRANNSHDAWSINLEIAVKRSKQKLRFLAVLDLRVAIVEVELPVNVGDGTSARLFSVPRDSSSANNAVPGMGV